MPKGVELCSKCGDNAVSGEGYPRWCKNCKACYRRENEVLRASRTEKRGFAAGIMAMREALAVQFEGLGNGVYRGVEVAQLIREASAPRTD